MLMQIFASHFPQHLCFITEISLVNHFNIFYIHFNLSEENSMLDQLIRLDLTFGLRWHKYFSEKQRSFLISAGKWTLLDFTFTCIKTFKIETISGSSWAFYTNSFSFFLLIDKKQWKHGEQTAAVQRSLLRSKQTFSTWSPLLLHILWRPGRASQGYWCAWKQGRM